MQNFYFRKFLISLLNLCLFVACDKPSETNSSLGTFTSPDQIQKSQSDSLAQLSPENILVGQRIHFVESQEIFTTQGPQKSLSKEWVMEIIEKETEDPLTIFTFLRTEIDYTLPDQPTFKFRGLLPFQNLSQSAKKAVTNLKLSYQLLEDSPAKPPEVTEILDITFHNLAKTQVQLNPPEAVSTSPNCQGLNQCMINADEITYEVVFHFSNNTSQKHQVQWLISNEVPYFASILKQCASTIVALDDARVLVQQCQDVVDFSF